MDITIQNFETELIDASMAQPVLLDIWAPWCAPCRALAPVLEKLEVAYAGRFRLAKLNSDEQPEISGQLSQMFGVRSIPFCVLFKGGQPVDGFVGALPEAQLREFLDKHVPGVDELEAAEDVEAAQELAADGDADAALERLQEAVALNPANDAARGDYVRALLESGRVADARRAFAPAEGRVLADARLAALGVWLAACEGSDDRRDQAALTAAIAANKRDFDARFELAELHLVAGRRTEALDELLEILMRDKAWAEQKARKTYVAILELMTRPAAPATAGKGGEAPKKGALEIAGKAAVAPSSDPVVDQYRRKLSMVLF
jgi:putative thioredoxin